MLQVLRFQRACWLRRDNSECHVIRDALNLVLTFINSHNIGSSSANLRAMAEPKTPRPITANLLFIVIYLVLALGLQANLLYVQFLLKGVPNCRHPNFLALLFGIEACVIDAGCPDKLSTPPKLAKVKTFIALTTSAVASKPASLTVKLTIPPNFFI